MKNLTMYCGRFLREILNHTVRVARLSRSSRAPQPINDARVACYVWNVVVWQATCTVSICRLLLGRAR